MLHNKIKTHEFQENSKFVHLLILFRKNHRNQKKQLALARQAYGDLQRQAVFRQPEEP